MVTGNGFTQFIYLLLTVWGAVKVSLQSLLYYYLLIIVLFSIQTTVNLPLSHPI